MYTESKDIIYPFLCIAKVSNISWYSNRIGIYKYNMKITEKTRINITKSEKKNLEFKIDGSIFDPATP